MKTLLFSLKNTSYYCPSLFNVNRLNIKGPLKVWQNVKEV